MNEYHYVIDTQSLIELNLVLASYKTELEYHIQKSNLGYDKLNLERVKRLIEATDILKIKMIKKCAEEST